MATRLFQFSLCFALLALSGELSAVALDFPLTHRFRIETWDNAADLNDAAGQGMYYCQRTGQTAYGFSRLSHQPEAIGASRLEKFTPGDYYSDGADGYVWMRTELFWTLDWKL